MDNVTAQANGFVTGYATLESLETKIRSVHFWRPWTAAKTHKRQTRTSSKPYMNLSGRSLADKNSKPDGISHPVKLFWPRSRCYDYLYQDAEALLRNYPVQATISLCEDSCSDDEESDQECEKELK